MLFGFQLLLSFIAGLLLWSFIEYLIHGILSHRFRTPVSTMHWQHHKNPRRVFTSPIAPLIICPVLWWAFSMIVGKLFALVLICGTLCGFVYYEYAHWRIHFREPKSEYQKRLKAHHLAHHFCNARLYHGVTSTLWDKIFATMGDSETRHVHYQKAVQTPPMQGVSNLKEIYSLQGFKVLINTFRKDN